VKRQVSLKSLDDGKIEEASKGSARQKIASGPASTRSTPSVSTSSSRTWAEGVSSQTQGEQLRITGKKRDDLQAVIAVQGRRLRHPLQFNNFRD